MARRNHAAPIALGGVFAALAIVIMCMGGLIPVATFVCPAVCILLLETVRQNCSNRIGWAWYGAVSILAVLLGPDKEAAAVFAFLGWYPIVKPYLEKWPLSLMWKLLFFNIALAVMYWLLLSVFGLAEIAQEYAEFGLISGAIMVLLGNATFVLLDLLLNKIKNRFV
jgi:hypothetical protein